MISILQKVLSELNEEVPDVSYVRGLIEAAMEMSNVPAPAKPLVLDNKVFTASTGIPTPADNRLAEIKRMSEEGAGL